MRSSLPSFDRRGLRLSALALAGATLLAACDNDRAVGPKAPAAPATAILVKPVKTGALRITILDQNKALPTTSGAQFSVAKSDNKTFIAVDDGPGDMHSLAGSILMVNLQPGTYTVCQTVAPADYVLPTPPACQPIDVIPGTSNLGDASHVQFGILTVPRASWVAFDAINWDTIPGITVTGDDGSGPVTIADNSPLDLDPAPGKFEVKVPKGSSYTVCPKATPPGYVFPPIPQGCLTKPVAPGQTTALGNVRVRHEYSAYWFVSLGGGVSHGSEFTVTHAATGNTITVADDGLNDMAPASMMVYVKLSAPGWYTVCMSVPPKGGYLADPVCKRIEVHLGEFGFAGDFDSKPI